MEDTGSRAWSCSLKASTLYANFRRINKVGSCPGREGRLKTPTAVASPDWREAGGEFYGGVNAGIQLWAGALRRPRV